jgi:hypothetical protein
MLLAPAKDLVRAQCDSIDKSHRAGVVVPLQARLLGQLQTDLHYVDLVFALIGDVQLATYIVEP